MESRDDDWPVLEHGPLLRLQEDLWQVEGELPKMSMGRRMCVAKRSDGGLVIHNSVALEEEAMSSVEALGPIAYILVPSAFHRIDAARFHGRFPDAKVLSPKGSRKKVSKVVAVDGSYDDFPEDETVSLRHLKGMKAFEGVMTVKGEDGTTLVFNDALFNLPHGSGMGGLILKVMGSSGGPKVTRIMRLFAIKDKKALAADLRTLAETPGLSRLVPGHGIVIEDNAAQVLGEVADALHT